MNKKPKALFNDVGARLGQVRVVKRRHASPQTSQRGTFRATRFAARFQTACHAGWTASDSFFLSAHLTSIFEARATEHSNQSPGNINTDKILVSAQSVWFPLNPQLDL